MQDAECGMQKLTHSQERADRVPMQDAGAECKNSPNIGRRGQKKSRTECTMQVRNTESHPRVHCVCREGLYGADALYADCMLHATCLVPPATPRTKLVCVVGGPPSFFLVVGEAVASAPALRRRPSE